MNSRTDIRLDWRRRWLFRLAAVGVGLLPFLLLEAGLILLGWGEPDPRHDPFVGFASIKPLFQRDEQSGRYVVAPSRRDHFADEQFPLQKAENGFRIFCLGGSTVQGNPFSIETAFSTWLELALQEADPSRNWEVINCGGVSYASYRLVPILQECLEYQPDLFLICTGHNEFLEDRTYAHVRRVPGWLQGPIDVLSRRRLVVVSGELARQTGVLNDRSRSELLKPEADALLDYRDGLKAFHRDPERAATIHRHFESNLERMVRIARDAGVPVLLIRPPSNLSDQPPFKSEYDESLNPDVIERCRRLLEEARQSFETDLDRAIADLKQAVQLDPEHARAWYELGHGYETLGDYELAREAYVQARDRDVCPLRMTTPLENALFRVADRQFVPFLDAHALLEAEATHGILGGYWLVDHVHPSFEGHQKIALALVTMLEELSIVTPAAGWRERSRAAFQAHFESLESTYFHHGQQMLRALRNWTQGDRDGPPVEEHFPHRLRPDDR